MANTKRFTIAQVLDAMEANNVPHLRGGWFDTVDENDRIGAACIMGQTAINLGVDRHSLMTELNRILPDSGSTIISWNDGDKLLYPTMVSRARTLFSGRFDREVNLTTKFYQTKLVKSEPVTT